MDRNITHATRTQQCHSNGYTTQILTVKNLVNHFDYEFI